MLATTYFWEYNKIQSNIDEIVRKEEHYSNEIQIAHSYPGRMFCPYQLFCIAFKISRIKDEMYLKNSSNA